MAGAASGLIDLAAIGVVALARRKAFAVYTDGGRHGCAGLGTRRRSEQKCRRIALSVRTAQDCERRQRAGGRAGIRVSARALLFWTTRFICAGGPMKMSNASPCMILSASSQQSPVTTISL